MSLPDRVPKLLRTSTTRQRKLLLKSSHLDRLNLFVCVCCTTGQGCEPRACAQSHACLYLRKQYVDGGAALYSSPRRSFVPADPGASAGDAVNEQPSPERTVE